MLVLNSEHVSKCVILDNICFNLGYFCPQTSQQVESRSRARSVFLVTRFVGHWATIVARRRRFSYSKVHSHGVEIYSRRLIFITVKALVMDYSGSLKNYVTWYFLFDHYFT